MFNACFEVPYLVVDSAADGASPRPHYLDLKSDKIARAFLLPQIFVQTTIFLDGLRLRF